MKEITNEKPLISGRIISMDLLRIFSLLGIMYYHFLIELSNVKLMDSQVVPNYFSTPNLHIATLGVGLFFMISGAGLVISTEKKIVLKEYFKKRVLRLLIPYYIAWAGTFCFLFLRNGVWPIPKEIETWRVVFSLLGMDGYLNIFGIRTMYIMVGEWFVGALEILYLLFPVFRYFMKKSPKLFFIAATAVYLFMVIKNPFTIPIHQNIVVKMFEFILGMYLIEYREKIKGWVFFPAAGAIVLALFWKTPIAIPDGLKITLVCIAFFVSAYQLENILEKMKGFSKILNWLQKDTYQVFLVHHVVLVLLIQNFIDRNLLRKEYCLLFVLILLVSWVIGMLLAFLEKKVHEICGWN